jgi:hypothetical protein
MFQYLGATTASDAQNYTDLTDKMKVSQTSSAEKIRMKVYSVEPMQEGIKYVYRTYILENDADTKLVEERKHKREWFEGQLIGKDWPLVTIVPRSLENPDIKSDLPYVSGLAIQLIFNRRAIEVLSDLLEGNGELLPLICDEGEYWLFNITRFIDALDSERTEFKLESELDPDWVQIGDEPEVMLISKYEFHVDQIRDLTIFKIPSKYRNRMPLVTDKFVQRVNEAGLVGFGFELLWSSNDSVTC